MAAIATQTFLVTGSTDGIGRHTALKLAKANHAVIIHGRNKERVESTVKEIQTATGNKQISSYVYDLSSQKQVRQFAADIRRDFDSIDVLINNAAVFETQHKISEDGFENTWSVNVLAPYLINCLLLDRVKSRIINVSSISAGSRIDFDKLQQEKGYSDYAAYSLSKLCIMLITFKMADEMRNSKITVNCLDPGTVNTKMLIAGWGNIGIPISEADNLFKLATDPAVSTTTGEYFVSHMIRTPPPASRDKKIQEKLWEVLQEHTKETMDFSKVST